MYMYVHVYLPMNVCSKDFYLHFARVYTVGETTQPSQHSTRKEERGREREMKYSLVSGGVISGIGKGVITSSIGTLLKSVGLKVTAIKIDPYLNIDAGTFSPYEHGKEITFFSIGIFILRIVIFVL